MSVRASVCVPSRQKSHKSYFPRDFGFSHERMHQSFD